MTQEQSVAIQTLSRLRERLEEMGWYGTDVVGIDYIYDEIDLMIEEIEEATDAE